MNGEERTVGYAMQCARGEASSLGRYVPSRGISTALLLRSKKAVKLCTFVYLLYADVSLWIRKWCGADAT